MTTASRTKGVNRSRSIRRRSPPFPPRPGGRHDPLSASQRRALMQSVKQRDTRPEIVLRLALWSAGFRYRINRRIGRTTPDLLFVGKRVAVYVDGCFWHGCPRHYSAPKNNASFWKNKVEENRLRDHRGTAALVSAGWTVLRFWSCQVIADLPTVVQSVESALQRVTKASGSSV